MTSQNISLAKVRKWNLPLTYKPKIESVKRGDCRQTIRMGRKFKEGDLVRFYIWKGKPYRSKRETITEYFLLREVWEIDILPTGISTYDFTGYPHKFYTWVELDWLARRDYITPPTGEALRDVLIEKNGKTPDEGIEAQIIRW